MKVQCIVLCLLLSLTVGLSATKYAGEIFQLSPGVANQALGNTGLTNYKSTSGAWWNPALLATMDFQGLELSYSQHFEGLLTQNQISLVFGKKNHNAIIINHLSIDDIKLTRLENENDPVLSNDNRPIVWKTVGNNDLIVHFALSRSLTPNIHLGFAPKVVYRSLAENNGYGFGADLGLLFTGSDALSLGLALRDFFSTQLFWENGTHETVTPSLDAEASYIFFRNNKIPAQLFVRSQAQFEDREEAATHTLGFMSLDYHAGLKIQVLPSLNLMGGYDVDAFTAGIGLKLNRFALDYAFKYGSEDSLGNTQRLALGVLW